MILQLAGLALLAWAAAYKNPDPLSPFERQILILAIAAVAIVALQLVPLPWAFWSEMGPRREIAAGYQLLGLLPNAAPLSLKPYDALASLFGIIPGLAVFCSMLRLKAYRPEWMALALLAATLAGIVVGVMQVGSAIRPSPWYFYPETNVGSAVGFFANANHMGILLVSCFPLLAAVAALPKAGSEQRDPARLAFTFGGGLLVLVGVALNGSFAAYALALPVLAASALIVSKGSRRVRLWGSIGAVLLLLGSVAVLVVEPVGTEVLSEQATVSVQSRQEIYSATSRAVGDFFPWGSGLGSFPSVYHLYEDPNHVTTTYVVHAHNDYLELALETGIAGIILLTLFLGCWCVAVWRVWRTAEAGPFPRAASIATAAILAHSVVDFPLRTAAITASFGMFLAMLAMPPVVARKLPGDLRAVRHKVLR
ncbi:MAG: O-antigen ligase family protein [Sphingomonas sp.]|nr:O-antigen ligase family protein [Sphingomonas sp.]